MIASSRRFRVSSSVGLPQVSRKKVPVVFKSVAIKVLRYVINVLGTLKKIIIDFRNIIVFASAIKSSHR